MLYSRRERSFTGQVATEVPTCANRGRVIAAIADRDTFSWLVNAAGSAWRTVAHLLLVGAFVIDQPRLNP